MTDRANALKPRAIAGARPVTQARPRRRAAPVGTAGGGLENAFEQRLLLALDRRRLAFRHRLADRGVLAQPLRFLGRIDDDTGLGRRFPEDQGVDEAAVALQQLRILLVDDLPNVGIDVASAGLLQERHLALAAFADRQGGGDRGVALVAGTEYRLPRPLGRRRL